MQRDSRKIAAILAADVVEYSRLMGADEAGTLAALKSRRETFEELVREFDGRVFGSVGDSLMAEFASAVNAVSCALEIQQRIEAGHASQPSGQRMHLRIGVNLGDVIEEKDTVFGDAVNVAARLQALAKPGGVLISGPVYDQVHLKVPAHYIDAGLRQVKNIEEPLRTFEVLPPEAPGLAGRIAGFAAQVASRRVRRAALVVAVLAGAVALGQYWREIPVPGAGRSLGELLQPGEPAAPANAIAVLPFVNLSGDPANNYLGDGIAEELLHRLAKIPELRVAARTSAFAFKGKDRGVEEISRQLGVRYVVEGSVRRQGGLVRVNATLVDGASGASRWSNSYETPAGDYFVVESEIGAQVIAALRLVLGTGAESPTAALPSGSSVAHDYFLQGLFYLRQPRSGKSLDAAEMLFRRALTEQPGFARAQAGLCQTYVERYALERVPARVAVAEEACASARALDSGAQEVHEAVGRLRLATGDAGEAEAAYRQALALVPRSPDALIGLAQALAAGGKTQEAEEKFRDAIAAQPSYASAHNAYGNFLFALGRAGDAVASFERTTVLTPDNPDAFNNLGIAYMLAGDFDQASRALAQSLAIEPRRGGYVNSGTVEYYRGRYRPAQDMFRKSIELVPTDHRAWGNLADALRFDAQPEEARRAYRKALDLVEGELAVNPSHAINQAQAAYYAIQLGDAGRARRGIESALSQGDGNSYYVYYYVALAELGLGDKAQALAHVRRALELGYPEVLLKAAPELGDIRTML